MMVYLGVSVVMDNGGLQQVIPIVHIQLLYIALSVLFLLIMELTEKIDRNNTG